MVCSRLSRITLKDVKAFLPRINCKISTNKWRELFQDVDTKKRGEFPFDDFAQLYHKIMYDENVSIIIDNIWFGCILY